MKHLIKNTVLSLLLLASPMLIAAEQSEGKSAAPDGAQQLDAPNVAAGLKWFRVKQTYHAVGNASTWAYAGSPINAWIVCSDNMCEQMLIAASESGHWLGAGFTGTGANFTYLRLWKN